MIGENVQVIVQSLGRGKVSLAIYAPKSVRLAKTQVASKPDGGADGR